MFIRPGRCRRFDHDMRLDREKVKCKFHIPTLLQRGTGGRDWTQLHTR